MSNHEDKSGSCAAARHLPLNSKRLTAAHLKQIAHSLSLPTTGAADQLCQVIEGKLATDGYETANYQVVLEEDKFVEIKLSLLSMDGTIVESEPVKRDATDVTPDLE